MGYGILFKVDDESAKNHIGERRIKTDVKQQSITDLNQIPEEEI